MGTMFWGIETTHKLVIKQCSWRTSDVVSHVKKGRETTDRQCLHRFTFFGLRLTVRYCLVEMCPATNMPTSL